MAAPEYVQKTWTFLYTDMRFEIISTYEATPPSY